MCVTSLLLLSSLGLAITAQAQDCLRPVGGGNMTLNDDLPTYPDGTRVTFACNVGYVQAGSTAITCTAGSWSTLRLRCNRNNCGSAGDVEYGNIDYPEGTEFGDRLKVTCRTGYRRVGQEHLHCGAQGWLGRLPVCEVVSCNPPPAPKNVTFRPNKDTYTYGEVVQYTCQNDVTLSGSSESSCSVNGMFEPAPPACIYVECPEPNIPDAHWVGGSRPPHRYQATVTYVCNSGFAMIGQPTLTCEIGRQWSPEFPKCQAITPQPKPSTTTTPITTTTIRPTDGTSNDGDTKAVWLGVCLTVLIVSVLTACGCYFCGVPAIIKEKRRSRRGLPDNVVPKDGEEVALS
ncbi:membrane cofactor protein-like isoform X5 [Sebastes umbrosus]|uniref:membrane cofactor protein-like isoform X5 n=1 Tax=Sebastes umbrosus TaxID=72105 RepID=UPI00189EC6CF|nr:membrane cofactor protein-like isoform X5 [Sebastes umbrosus]